MLFEFVGWVWVLLRPMGGDGMRLVCCVGLYGRRVWVVGSEYR